MKVSDVVLVALLGVISSSAFASGGTVGSDKVTIASLSSIDCREGSEYWKTNRGLKISLSENSAYSYRKNDHERGDKEPVQCSADGNYVVCQGYGFLLTIPDISKVEVQSSADLEDLLGSMMGVPNKRVKAVNGTLESEGIIFDSKKPVVCAIK